MGDYCFYHLFTDDVMNYALAGCSDLLLPATDLSNYCYYRMFSQCKSLTLAPALPATNLAPSCYRDMFEDCGKPTAAPDLPATTLAVYCYHGMFNNCTRLIKAPDLPASKLITGCYYNMFSSCTSLATAPAILGKVSNEQCHQALYGMFRYCANLTTIPSIHIDDSYTTSSLPQRLAKDFFNGCTKLKLSTTRTTECPNEYVVPIGGHITNAGDGGLSSFFAGTGGTYTSDPELYVTYYTNATVLP